MNTPVTGALRWVLRIEALAVLLISAWAYGRWGGSWAQFALWFLLPDVALLGYGLKYSEGFGSTHLGRIAQDRQHATEGMRHGL